MARYDYLQTVMGDGRMLFDIAGFSDDVQKSPEQWATVNADTVHFFHVYSGETEDASNTRHEEQAFARHNRDDRPRGREIRSMSVGDVLVIRGERYGKQDPRANASRVLICRNMGWTEIMELEWTDGNVVRDRLIAAADRKAHTTFPLTDLVNALNRVMAGVEKDA